MTSSSRIVVFAGPSLPPSARPPDDRLSWRGPAAAGDAVALKAERPDAVVLIDGLFDAWPAIRHKELLELMASGVPLFGAASMGALRAAELAPFGMLGFGAVYRAFAAGRLTGDDEVAVLHAPQEMDWALLTEAMVNIRATVQSAVRRRIVRPATGRFLQRIAKATFYKERTWARLLRKLSAWGAPDEARALEAWLPGGRIDLKRADALACVDAALAMDARDWKAPEPPPRTVYAVALEDQVVRGVRGR
jgi:hypothetical protein